MEPLHSHLQTLLILLAVFTSARCQDTFWSNLIGRVPEGVAGVDYPDYARVPKRTAFNCRDRKPGFYADPETRCQAWHWCDTFLIKHSFLCANMTLFNQKIRGCDWWYNVDCNLAVSQYVNNDELYQVDTPSSSEQEQERHRRNRKQWSPPEATPVSNDLGAEQSVNGFTVTNAVSQQPEAALDISQKPAVPLDFSRKPDEGLGFDDTLFFSASSAAPATELPFFDTTTTTARILLSSSPATRGVVRARPVTQVPIPVRQIFVRPNTGGFQINIANAIPIVFPPPPPKVQPSTTTTARSVSVDFGTTLVADVATTNGFEIQRNPAINKEKPAFGLTKPRRRLRFRTRPPTAATRGASSELPQSGSTAFLPASQPPVINPTDPHTITTTTTRVAPTALPAFPFPSQPFAAPPGSSQVNLNDFFAPQADGRPTTETAERHITFPDQPSSLPALRTTSTSAPPALPPQQQEQRFSRFPEFPPFPGTTAQRQPPSRPPSIAATSFRPSTSRATPRPFLSTSSTERIDLPTVPFNFGIPFGARIRPGAAVEHLEQAAATVRRSDNFLPDATTGDVEPEATPQAPRKRKFVDVGKTFPPFPVSTVLSPKYTKIANPSSELPSELFTATSVDSSDVQRLTPKPTKRRRKIATTNFQWTNIPITTFRPQIKNLTTKATSSNFVAEEATEEVTKTSSTESVSLQDDISLA